MRWEVPLTVSSMCFPARSRMMVGFSVGPALRSGGRSQALAVHEQSVGFGLQHMV